MSLNLVDVKDTKHHLKYAVKRAFPRADQQRTLLGIIEVMDKHGQIPRGMVTSVASRAGCSTQSVFSNREVLERVIIALEDKAEERNLLKRASKDPIAKQATRLLEACREGVTSAGEAPSGVRLPQLASLTTPLEDRCQELQRKIEAAERAVHDLRGILGEQKHRFGQLHEKVAALVESPATQTQELLKEICEMLHVRWPKGEVSTDSVVQTKKERQALLIKQLGLPSITREGCTITYGPRFLKALLKLEERDRRPVIKGVCMFAKLGRMETFSSQQHKLYDGILWDMPTPMMVARVNRRLRYFWKMLEKNGARELLVYDVVHHDKAYASEL